MEGKRLTELQTYYHPPGQRQRYQDRVVIQRPRHPHHLPRRESTNDGENGNGSAGIDGCEDYVALVGGEVHACRRKRCCPHDFPFAFFSIRLIAFLGYALAWLVAVAGAVVVWQQKRMQLINRSGRAGGKSRRRVVSISFLSQRRETQVQGSDRVPSPVAFPFPFILADAACPRCQIPAPQRKK